MRLDNDERTNSIRRARAELNDRQRERLGPTEMLGDLIVASLVPVLLWNDVPRGPLVAWSIVVSVLALFWSALNRVNRTRSSATDSHLTYFGWVSTFVWGALPWVAWEGLDERGAVWIMVFVVTFAIAADTVFVTQTSSISIDEMVLVYTASFLLALALHDAWIALVAVLVSGVTSVVGGAGLARVTAELVQQRADSENRSRIDALTGIGSRMAATEAIAALVAERVDEIHCAFIDLDDFKQLNDNYGYDVGDAALRSVANLLVTGLPADWTVARFGGDEFVAVGPSRPDLQAIIEIQIALPDHGGLVLSQPMSMGITSLPVDEASADQLFLEGAAALRLAKRLGKHQIVQMNDELRAAERATVQLCRRTATALEEREIVPWGQPIVDLEDQRMIGIELLARWPQPDGSIVMPNQFVPVIEDQGRGPALGLLMIEHAICALASDSLRGTDVYVSANVSARHLFHRRLPREVANLLAKHRVPAARLVLEITESQHLPSSPVWRETARQLRRLGVGLAIDDFGTGYSSMEQLLCMPFSHLKIDRVMTQALGRPGAVHMAAGIIAMANGSGMTTVVEGIETEFERSTMLRAGCRLGQGYLFARPAPLDEVLDAFVEPVVASDIDRSAA